MLTLLAGDLAVLRVAGSGRVVLSCFVTIQSRRRPKPIHAAVAGPSGVGKSYETGVAVLLITPSDVYIIADGSEKFIVYDTKPLTGLVVYFVEATPIQRDGNAPLAYAVRTLMSEGEFRYRYTDFDKKNANGDPSVREIVRRGPAVVLVTSTADKLHPEIETRLVRFVVDSSPEQTARILDAMAQDLDAPPPDATIAEWRAFDELLTRFGTADVVVPFGAACSRAVTEKAKTLSKPLASRLRRDYRHVLTAVQTIAFLNQYHRKCDAVGRIVAEQLDWDWASSLLDPSLNRGALRALTPSELAVFDSLDKKSAASKGGAPAPFEDQLPTPAPGRPIGGAVLNVPSRKLAAECGLDHSTVLRAFKILSEGGYIQEPEPLLKQRSSQWQVVARPRAQAGRQVLPSWEEILAQLAPAPAAGPKPASAPNPPPSPEPARGAAGDPGRPGAGRSGIPFMMTEPMKQVLRRLGYSDQDIAALTPVQAFDIVEGRGAPAGTRQPAGAPSSPDQPEPALDEIPEDWKQDLRDLGHSNEDIAAFTPKQAAGILLRAGTQRLQPEPTRRPRRQPGTL